MYPITEINCEDDYQRALDRLSDIWESQRGTPEGDELEALANLIEAYEKIHYPFPPPEGLGYEEGRRSNACLVV